jgi:LmbE family N-acetylglucosaminyl deacetylase
MTGFYQHIYLAPHYDDAALSCGGMIHQQTQAGQLVLVVTIFAAPPESNEPLSPFAESQHQQWGNPQDAISVRQAEDQAAMQILGADYLRLKFTDCIYRGEPRSGEWYYLSDADLFGQVHPAERPLIPQIAEAILELVPAGDDTTVFAPLTVGHHVDHQLVNAAAWQLRQQGYQLAFYEDYPYADPYFAAKYSHTEPAALVTQQPTTLEPQSRPIAEENLSAKIDSISAYSSQIPVLFGDNEQMAARVRDFVQHVGHGQPAERIWLPS